MATLFNTKISQTYQGLLKTIDNAALSATLRELTDGSGNQSGLFLNKSGDFKVSAILEWGSLKDTGTGVTITQFVTAANGIQNFNNDTTVPTSAAVKLYVDTKFSTTDTLTEVLGFGNTTSGKDIAVSAGDDITLTTTSKIIMGTSGAAGNFQIYNDGSNSYINENGAGDLRISTNGAQVTIQNGLSEDMGRFIPNSSVILYYDNVQKFLTTSAGAQVTGNLVVTGTITGAGGSFLPLAGGTMTGNTLHGDNVKSVFGTSGDFELYYNGTDAYLDNYNGNINIVNRSNDKDIILQSDNGSGGLATYILIDGSSGAVELNHYGFKKFETTGSGVSVNGNLTINGSTFAFGNITYYDNVKALFGDASDLQIYHDGGNSFIRDLGTGNLLIDSNGAQLKLRVNTTESALIANSNGSVELYYNNIKKLETVVDGAKVTGNLEVTGTITGSGGSFLPLAGGTMTGDTTHNDNVKSIYGTSGDGLKIFHDGSDSFIRDLGTGNLLITSDGASVQINKGTTENMAEFVTDGAVKLYYDSSKKFETTNTGISVTGNAALSAGFSIPDSQFGKFGTGDDIIIGHDSTNSIIRSKTGDFFIDQSAVTKSIIFRVSNANELDTTALTINREGDLTTGADVTIAGDLTVNGTTTTINTQTLAVEDPLIELSKDNAANSVDIGFYGKYNDGTARYLGLFSDASDSNKFRLFKGTTVQPTTTVNIAGSGYVAADLLIAGLEATTGTFLGKVMLGLGSPVRQLQLRTITGARNYGIGLNDKDGVEQATTAVDHNTNDLVTASTANMRFFSGSTIGGIAALPTNQTLLLDTSQNATFSGDVSLLDNKKLKFGAGNDLEIYSDGTDAYVESKVDDLVLRSADDIFIEVNSGANSIIGRGAASVELYYNNVLKFETTNTGFNATGSGRFRGEASPRIKAIGNTATGFPGFMLSNTGQEYEIIVGGNDSQKFKIRNVTNPATLLTIESGGNATFAGNVLINKPSNPTSLQIGSNLTDDPFIVFQTDGNTMSMGIDRGDSNKFKISDNATLGTNDRFTIDTSGNSTFAGNVGIGASASEKLSISDTGNVGISINNGTHTQYVASVLSAGGYGNGSQVGQLYLRGQIGIGFSGNNGGATHLTIDSSGNSTFGGTVTATDAVTVTGSYPGLSLTNPSNTSFALTNRHTDNRMSFDVTPQGGSTLEVMNLTSFGLKIFRSAGLSSNPQLIIATGESGSEDYCLSTDVVSAGDFCILEGSANVAANVKMRLHSRDVFFGTNTTTYPTSSNFVHINTQSGVSMTIGGHSGTHTAIQFRHNGATTVGSIVVTASSTTYNTSSDYRLKEDLQDFAGLDMVSKIPVYDFKWKVDENRSYGVMAHELQEILPQAVTGEKDAEEMQQVDYSKIVPLLIKSIQELTAKVEMLEKNCQCKN